MKSLFYGSILLLVTVGFFLAGCSRVPPPIKNTKTNNGDRVKSDPFRAVLDTFRYPENPRTSDDWTRFRDGLNQLAPYFSKPDVTARLRITAEDRKFLEKEVHLTEAELAEVESPSFRTADAHYLDECFLLRDAARTLEISGLNPIDQAEVHFRWVMANVLLHEQGDTWIPPAFALRRGYGSAVERSLVFLALLRQSRIDGCLIVLPDSDPLQFLVAVHEPKTENLYLFDTRLGLALKSKDRKTGLTLKDALAEPASLQPAQIAPEQVKKLEAWLACPVYALAPRMLELEKGLSAYDAISLYQSAAMLHQEVARIAKIPATVWNPPMQGKSLPNSPTRCLRLFLPTQEGGADETKRAENFARTRIPFALVLANWTQINVNQDLLPRLVFQTFLSVTEDLFNKFDLQPREMYLRGQYEAIVRRQERLRAFTTDDALVGLVGDRAFDTELAKWRKLVSEANAVLGNDKAPPQFREQAQNALQSLASQDMFIAWMLHLDNEQKFERDVHKKTVITQILAVGVRDYFDLEMAYARAMTNHGKAVRAQASSAAAPKPTKSAEAKARGAWNTAHSSWSNFYLQRIVLTATIDQRLNQLRARFRPEEVEMRVGLLESLHLEVQKYFNAKLHLAECKHHLEDEKKARAYLEEVKREIEELQKKAPLQAEIKNLSASVQGMRPPFKAFYQQRLDLLARDWSPNGSYFWMKRQLEQRIATKP